MKQTLTLFLLYSTLIYSQGTRILKETFDSGSLPTGWSRTQASGSVC